MGARTNTRIKTRRKLDQAADHCNMIAQYLADINDIYEDTHVDVSTALLHIGEVNLILQGLITTVRKNI